ncbi:T9SS type A sorting domain-containing protein [Pseudopedobacter beijingensis]|uniref:T9SS type A sorting domain-containing protein n=1 Tax=Pseudopedobacter beijingensis TaxID=1207056 RepID=A0ABW4I7I6_9SPHI
MKKTLLFWGLGLLLSDLTYGQIFQQNFSTSPMVSSYFNATAPGQNQFNRIENLTHQPSSIVDEKLRFEKKSTGNSSANFTRYTAFSTNPTFLQIKFKYQLVANGSTSTSSQSKFFVGDDFPTNGADPELNYSNSIHSFFEFFYSGVNGGFKVGNGTALSNQYTGQQEITFVINNTGTTIGYAGPNGQQQTILNDTWDLWVGTDKALAGVAAKSPSASINKFMFFARYNGLTATYEFDDFEIHDNTTLTLPVTFKSFTANKTSNATVALKWETIEEKNNSHFEIYKSTDGENFSFLQSISAKGNDFKGITAYAIEDLNPVTGDNYYKLVQIDKDGTKSEYPNVISARIAVLEPQVKIFTKGETLELDIVPLKEGLNELVISDISGRAVYVKNVYLSMGSNRLEINKGLSSGVYIVSLKSSDKNLRFKFSK